MMPHGSTIWLLLVLGLAVGLLQGTKAADDQAQAATLATEFELKQGSLPFADIKVHYQMYDNPRKEPAAIVFLHGARFTSDDWVKLGTLKLARQVGYRAIAMDLPGFGKTGALPYSDNNMRAEVLKTVLTFAQPKANHTLILVSPSLSGKYSIPYLDRYGLLLDGFVAIAPVGVKAWGGPWEDTHRKTSLLAFYGEEDPMQEDLNLLLKFFAKTQKEILPKAGHACYIDQPEAFHAKLRPFLEKIIAQPTPWKPRRHARHRDL